MTQTAHSKMFPIPLFQDKIVGYRGNYKRQIQKKQYQYSFNYKSILLESKYNCFCKYTTHS